MQKQALKNNTGEKTVRRLMALLLLLYGLKNIHQLDNIIVINDEFGYWGIAAHLAGKDWSSLLHTTPYYSYGYSLLLVPLFWLGFSSDVMYRTAVALNVLFLAGSYFLCAYCVKKLLPALSGALRCVLAFTIILYTNTVIQAQIAWSETLLYLLYWVIFTLAVRLSETSRISDVVLFGISNMYLYMVHQRCVGVLLASVLYICVLMLFRRLNLKQAACMGCAFLVLLMIHKYLKAYSINEIFSGNELVAMNDYSGQVGKIGFVLGSAEGFLSLLQSICGKLYYLGASTFLLGFTSAWFAVRQSFLFVCGWFRKKIRPEEDLSGYLIPFYLMLSFGATFLISAIAMSVSHGRLDLLIYGRYMEFAAGPVLLSGIAGLWKTEKKYRMILMEGIVLLALSMIVDRGLIAAESNSFNSYCATALNYFFDTRSAVPNLAFYISIMCTGTAVLLTMFFRPEKDRRRGIFAVCIVLAALWNWLSGSTPVFKGQSYVQNCIGDIGAIIEAEDYRHIYFLDSSDIAIEHYIPVKFLQYRLTDYSVHLIEDTDDISAETEKNYCILTYETPLTMEEHDFYLLKGKSNSLKLYIPETGGE